MKKILALLILSGSLAGAQQLSVVVSMQPHYALVKQLVGDAASVSRILPLGASPHTFDPTPQDVARIAGASLIIANGGLDEWVLELVAAAEAEAPVVELLDALEFEPISGEDEHGAGAEEAAHEQDHEHAHSGVNPHLWLDPVLMAQAVPVLVAALGAADPDNAELYTQNGDALAAELTALDAELRTELAPVAGAPFIPFHDAWPYFVRRYGLNQVAVLEPSPGREPSPRYLADVLQQMTGTGATALFTDVGLPPRPAEVVAEEAGVELYTLDPEATGGDETESYADFMRRNAAVIVGALAQ